MDVSRESPVAPSLPRLNEPAPDFEAMTTHGPRRLSDYQGKWLVLFSHPADFTPVCTTEFLGFAAHQQHFGAIGCELLGLSVDSVHAHVAWIRNIEEKFGVKIAFPIVADLSGQVARQYGMIQPGASSTEAVRATFVIDPSGAIRAMVYYPMSNGRSVSEILRLVRALQTTEHFGVATPEAWQPGEPAIVPPPDTVEAAAQRLAEDYDCVDWYFCKRPLPQAAETTRTRAPASTRESSRSARHNPARV